MGRYRDEEAQPSGSVHSTGKSDFKWRSPSEKRARERQEAPLCAEGEDAENSVSEGEGRL